MSEEQLEEMGPIDYVVLEWKGDQPDAGEVQSLLLDLVDRGVIRILDIAFLAKDEDGSVSGIELGELKQVAAAFAEFEGASSGLLGYEDLEGPPPRWTRGPRPPCSSGRTVGQRPWLRPCAAVVASWSPAAASRCRPSWPRSTRSKPPPNKGVPMPGLLRGVARTAVVADTATAVSNRVSRRQAERWQRKESAAYGQPEPAYQEPGPQDDPPPQAAPAPDFIQQLRDLADLKGQGILTEEEFAAQKARISAAEWSSPDQVSNAASMS